MKSCAYSLVLGLLVCSSLWAENKFSEDWQGTMTARSQQVILSAHINSVRDGLYLGRMKSSLGANLAIDLIQVAENHRHLGASANVTFHQDDQ
jgi:hypothetical protein